jgi:hypothetical protein
MEEHQVLLSSAEAAAEQAPAPPALTFGDLSALAGAFPFRHAPASAEQAPPTRLLAKFAAFMRGLAPQVGVDCVVCVPCLPQLSPLPPCDPGGRARPMSPGLTHHLRLPASRARRAAANTANHTPKHSALAWPQRRRGLT